jgi:creatinine amidohydrolase
MSALDDRARLPRRQWIEMTTTDFAALPANTVAVLPVAAIEQHGPHLPVYVDACINAGVIARTQKILRDDLPITFLPPQQVGKSNEHQAFPGTLTLSAETLTRLWTELGESVLRAGIRKLVLFNSHGGQPQIMDIVARDLRVRHGMFVVCANTSSFGWPAGLYPDAERAHGIHGGSSETSMMLALRPDLVRMEKSQNFAPLSVAMEREYRYLRPEGRVGFGWQTQDLCAAGACGNALDADAARGERALNHVAREFAVLLEEVYRFPLEALKERS